MKLLANAVFENLTSYLKQHARDFELDLRLEPYSCKMSGDEKKEWRRNIRTTNEANELHPLSPPDDSCLVLLSSSPFGTFNSGGRLRHLSELSYSGSDNDADENYGAIMVGTISTKTLFNLRRLLNLSYNDYNFEEKKSSNFTATDVIECKEKVNEGLSAVIPEYADIMPSLWKAVDDEIKFDECIVYSYIPECANDPFTEDGCIWTFNYFFWNSNLKRIVFFSCRALRSENLDVSSEQLWR